MTLMCMAEEAGKEVGRMQGENLQISTEKPEAKWGESPTLASGWALAGGESTVNSLRGLAE